MKTNREITPREWQIAQLLAQGKCNKEIARDLGVNVSTVAMDIHKIYRKTQTTRRSEIVAMVHGKTGVNPATHQRVVGISVLTRWREYARNGVMAMLKQEIDELIGRPA